MKPLPPSEKPALFDRLFLKLRARDEVTPEEEEALRGCIAEVKEVPAHRVIVRANEELSCSVLLVDGFLARYKDLRDGQRQITELHVPGDFADLHGFTLKRLDHNITTLTACRIALASHDKLKALTADYPHLTRILWFSTNLDAAIHREWEVSLGRRTALARVAHLFCELYQRLKIVGMTQDHMFELALTQTDISECLGLTSVHVNRTLRALREAGLLEFRGRKVKITDPKGLAEVAEFDPRYLYLEPRAR